MAHPPKEGMSRGSRIQLAALVIVTIFVMVVGVLVITYPKTFGLPGLGAGATPAAVGTPTGE
ncbi:MAG: hypothetical protein IT337_13440 [Thermomicrobiales bacterium]|nr:hypothetical protein [Thermomicrobiales bacterium]